STVIYTLSLHDALPISADRNFREIASGSSATSFWYDMTYFAYSMGQNNPDYLNDELYDTGISYSIFGSNSNSVINTLLNVVGLRSEEHTSELQSRENLV